MLKISFRNDMRRYFIFIILICSLLCICGCKANIPGNSSQAFPTSKIRGEDAIITPSPTFPAVSANIEELEPLKENELADNQSVGFPKDIDECFSICSNVVKGKVVSGSFLITVKIIYSTSKHFHTI